MSNEHNELPATIHIHLIRHEDEWHVVRLHDRFFQAGNRDVQPKWSQVEAKLTALGYTEVDEVPNQPGAQRKLVLTKPAAPSLLDNLVNPDVKPDTLLQQHPSAVANDDTVRRATRKYRRL